MKPPWQISRRQGKKEPYCLRCARHSTEIRDDKLPPPCHFHLGVYKTVSLHLLWRDNSSRYERNVSLLYLTHIWNIPHVLFHEDPPCVGSGSLAVVLSSYRTCRPLLARRLRLQSNCYRLQTTDVLSQKCGTVFSFFFSMRDKLGFIDMMQQERLTPQKIVWEDVWRTLSLLSGNAALIFLSEAAHSEVLACRQDRLNRDKDQRVSRPWLVQLKKKKKN